MEQVFASYGSTKYTGYAPNGFIYIISNETKTVNDKKWLKICVLKILSFLTLLKFVVCLFKLQRGNLIFDLFIK